MIAPVIAYCKRDVLECDVLEPFCVSLDRSVRDRREKTNGTKISHCDMDNSPKSSNPRLHPPPITIFYFPLRCIAHDSAKGWFSRLFLLPRDLVDMHIVHVPTPFAITHRPRVRRAVHNPDGVALKRFQRHRPVHALACLAGTPAASE